MELIQITPKQYAEKKGITTQGVLQRLKYKNRMELPDVIFVKKFGRFYILEVQKDFLKKD